MIANPNIRFLLLTGPEVPGHLTGRTIVSLLKNGVDPKTRKIIDAQGAIPYIENVPLEGIERFRQQIELVELINTQNPQKIQEKCGEIAEKNPGPFSEEAMWIDFTTSSGESRRPKIIADTVLLPEYGTIYDYITSQVKNPESHSIITEHPSSIIVEIREGEYGTFLVGKEA